MPGIYIGNTKLEIDQWYTSLNSEMLLLIYETLIYKFLIIVSNLFTVSYVICLCTGLYVG